MKDNSKKVYTEDVVIGNDGPVFIAYESLNNKTPKTNTVHGDQYGVTIVIPKDSKSFDELKKFLGVVLAKAQEVGSFITRDYILKKIGDGDKINKERASSVDKDGNPKEVKPPLEMYKNALVLDFYSKKQIPLIDRDGNPLRNEEGNYFADGLRRADVRIKLRACLGNSNLNKETRGDYATFYVSAIQILAPGTASATAFGALPERIAIPSDTIVENVDGSDDEPFEIETESNDTDFFGLN